MSRVRVKICGVTSLQDLLIAVDAGAYAVGLVVDVPRSPRNLSLNEAAKLMKSTPIFVETVVVTVPDDIGHLEEICKELNPGTIQVHGLNHLREEVRKKFPDAQLIGAVQAKPGLAVNTAVEAAEVFDAVLLDSYVSGEHGGTGKTHDWNLSKRVRDAVYPKPLILAGGLKPENVKEAICRVKPYAVDVSSGVEASPGVKDREKVFKFITNAKEVEI
jgi:phosphoribosylanthranilate isomerase